MGRTCGAPRFVRESGHHTLSARLTWRRGRTKPQPVRGRGNPLSPTRLEPRRGRTSARLHDGPPRRRDSNNKAMEGGFSRAAVKARPKMATAAARYCTSTDFRDTVPVPSSTLYISEHCYNENE